MRDAYRFSGMNSMSSCKLFNFQEQIYFLQASFNPRNYIGIVTNVCLVLFVAIWTSTYLAYRPRTAADRVWSTLRKADTCAVSSMYIAFMFLVWTLENANDEIVSAVETFFVVWIAASACVHQSIGYLRAYHLHRSIFDKGRGAQPPGTFQFLSTFFLFVALYLSNAIISRHGAGSIQQRFQIFVGIRLILDSHHILQVAQAFILGKWQLGLENLVHLLVFITGITSSGIVLYTVPCILLMVDFVLYHSCPCWLEKSEKCCLRIKSYPFFVTVMGAYFLVTCTVYILYDRICFSYRDPVAELLSLQKSDGYSIEQLLLEGYVEFGNRISPLMISNPTWLQLLTLGNVFLYVPLYVTSAVCFFINSLRQTEHVLHSHALPILFLLKMLTNIAIFSYDLSHLPPIGLATFQYFIFIIGSYSVGVFGVYGFYLFGK